ncbi:MAG: phage major capsid protein [Fimbriimonadaceae bacterium]
MNAKLQTMIKEAEGISADVESLLAEPTQENLLKAQDLNAKFKGLADDIELFRKAESDAHAHKEFLAQPVRDVPFETGASVVGMRPAGIAEFAQEKGATALFNDGEGLVDERQWRALGEPGYKAAFRAYLRRGEKGLTGVELKALQEGADASGGFLVPEDFVQRLLQRAPTPTRVQDRVMRMTTGRDAVVLPKVNYTTDDLYTTGIRATFSGEVPITASSIRVTEPAFGQARIPIYTAMLSMPLTNNMVEDASFPLQTWCEDKFAETIRLLKENMILNGSGIGQPTGILNNPGGTGQPAVVTMGNPITADGVVKMAWSVPEQYDENLAWVFNKTNAGQYLATLKDSNNRYLWGTGIQDSGLTVGADAAHKVLQGYPVLFQGFMPNLGANNYPVIFGDLRGYYLIDRIGFSIQVLRELYAETNQILLLGRVRFGGQVCEEFRLRIGQQA